MTAIRNNWLSLTLPAVILLAVAGCGAAARVMAAPDEAVTEAISAPPAASQPGELKFVSATGTDYLTLRDGADFAADLAYNRCAVSGTSAEFTPAWDSGGANSAVDAAYCLFRLQLNSTGPATLDLTWDGGAPEECWVALADWDNTAWDWHPLPVADQLELSDTAPYADGLWRCYAAVLVLGETDCRLASIGFSGANAASLGYTLVAPVSDTTTYLIDMDGTVVQTWESAYDPGHAAVITEEGHLIRMAKLDNPNFTAGGTGGRIEEYDWDGNMVWSFNISDTTRCTHHDFELLPSGNILLIVWVEHDLATVVQAGRNPATVPDGELWVDSIIEIQPLGVNSASVVWEWSAFDHLIQDHDPLKDNYGVPADHPELININFFSGPSADWMHTNAVYYNAELDQVVLSIHNFNELWIIDHSTTTIEAAGHSGGQCGSGGDLLYRWGNPRAYGAGILPDQQLFGQHDAQWIADGLDGAGDILIYNNGMNRPGGQFSTVTEITPPLNPDGTYALTGSAYLPTTPSWEYVADPPVAFYSANISSAQRLALGTTLVCCGSSGWLFEVSSTGEVVWEYTNPHGSPAPGGGKAVFRAVRYQADHPGLGAL